MLPNVGEVGKGEREKKVKKVVQLK